MEAVLIKTKKRSPSAMPQPLLDRCWHALSSRPFLALLLYVMFMPILELLHIFQTRRFLRARSAQPHRTREPETDRAAAERFWERVANNEPGICIDEIVHGWFVDRDAEPGGDRIAQQHPLRGNVLQLVAWTLFAQDSALVDRGDREAAEAIVHRLEKARGAPYPAGTAPGLECMRHTLGDLEPVWKPFGFYVAAALLRPRSAAD